MIFTAKNYEIYYKNMSNTEGVSILSTAEGNINPYTQWQYSSANIARDLFHMVDHLLVKYYKNILKMNSMKIV